MPGIMLDAAARLILVSQPSCCRNGMYSPNGTSRVLMYWPRMPVGLISTPTFSWPLPGTVVSWLTRRSAPSSLDSFSISASWTRFFARVRSTAVLLSPQTIRSGFTPLEAAGAAQLGGQPLAGVHPLHRVVDDAGLHHGDRDLPDGGTRRGERERQRPGADAGQPGGHAHEREPRAQARA